MNPPPLLTFNYGRDTLDEEEYSVSPDCSAKGGSVLIVNSLGRARPSERIRIEEEVLRAPLVV